MKTYEIIVPMSGDENHNHVWRDTPMPTPKKSKEELFASIVNAGRKGFWLKDKEREFGIELEREGKVKLCCGGKAAKVISDKENL